MNFTRHKYTVLALTLAIILFGIFAKNTLNMQLFPETAPPLVNVITSYPGASAEEVAQDISKPLEEEFATIDGVKTIKSTSQNDLSVVKVEFHYGTNIDSAAMDVENCISKILQELPSGAQRPQVLKFSTSDKPVITLGLKSESLSLEDVRTYADNEIKNAIQAVEGVAAVDIFGGYQRQVNIFLNKNRLKYYSLSSRQVVNALNSTNIATSMGRLTSERGEIALRLEGSFKSKEDIENTIVSERNGSVIRLKDVATVEFSKAELRSEYRYNGEKVIAVQVLKTDDANTVEVVEKVKEKVEELRPKFPSLQFVIAQDDSIFTKQVVDNMTGSIGYALLLTALIILMFVVSINESLVVSFSMPLSFLSTLGLMKIFNLQLDLITLSALILSIGFVVDNSIVVVENIVRHHKELGESITTAAMEGTKEITLAVLAGTSTTIIVLLPLLFIEGFVGKVFFPMATTLIFSIVSSLFVALIIIPLFVIMFQKKRWVWGEKKLAISLSPFTKFMELIKKAYISLLAKALNYRILTLVVCVIFLVGSAKLLSIIGMEVLPKLDTGDFNITIKAYSGSSLQETSQIVNEVEKILQEEKEVVGFSSQIGYEPGGHFWGESGALGVNQAYLTVNLTSRKERDESIWEIEDRIREKIALLPGIETFVVKESGGTAVATTVAPIDVRISGPDKEVLDYLGNEIAERVKKVPGAVNIYKGWSIITPEYSIKIDNRRASELGLSPQAVAGQVFGDLQGKGASELKEEQREDVAVKVRYGEKERENLEDFLDVVVTSPRGVQVPLRDLVVVEKLQKPGLVTREDLQYTLDIYGFTYKRTFSQVIRDIKSVIGEVELPVGYEMAITGEQADLQESLSDMRFALILAVVSVYLLLVTQFKSFVHPFTIMTAVPLVLIGVAAALKISGKAVSMPVLMGFILLAGTVVNNSILLVDYIIRAKEKGSSKKEAILGSVEQRFRPIMMTALSDVAGMLPLALELSLGSERFSPLATAVIGGILAATFLTMIVVPVTYSLLDSIPLFRGNLQEV